jgi:hypothetical protein
MGGWVGPRAGLDAVVKRKTRSPRQYSTPLFIGVNMNVDIKLINKGTEDTSCGHREEPLAYSNYDTPSLKSETVKLPV